MVPPEGCICKFTVHGSTYTRTAHEDCKAKHSTLEWQENAPPAKLKPKWSPAQQQAMDWMEKNKQDPGWIGFPTA